jgi:hypothetical protein
MKTEIGIKDVWFQPHLSKGKVIDYCNPKELLTIFNEGKKIVGREFEQYMPKLNIISKKDLKTGFDIYENLYTYAGQSYLHLGYVFSDFILELNKNIKSGIKQNIRNYTGIDFSKK